VLARWPLSRTNRRKTAGWSELRHLLRDTSPFSFTHRCRTFEPIMCFPAPKIVPAFISPRLRLLPDPCLCHSDSIYLLPRVKAQEAMAVGITGSPPVCPVPRNLSLGDPSHCFRTAPLQLHKAWPSKVNTFIHFSENWGITIFRELGDSFTRPSQALLFSPAVGRQSLVLFANDTAFSLSMVRETTPLYLFLSWVLRED